MAIDAISILGFGVQPYDPVGVELTSNYMTNGRYGGNAIIFPVGSTRDRISGSFIVPENYASGANLVIIHSSSVTTGDVEFDFEYAADGGDDTESVDPSSDDESVNLNDTAGSAVWERMRLTIALTDGNFAIGDLVQWNFYRDQVDAGDTISVEVIVHDVRFEFTTT